MQAECMPRILVRKALSGNALTAGPGTLAEWVRLSSAAWSEIVDQLTIIMWSASRWPTHNHHVIMFEQRNCLWSPWLVLYEFRRSYLTVRRGKNADEKNHCRNDRSPLVSFGSRGVTRWQSWCSLSCRNFSGFKTDVIQIVIYVVLICLDRLQTHAFCLEHAVPVDKMCHFV